MLEPDLEQTIERYHQALDAFMRGDAAPLLALYSRREDVTIANPFGPPVRGWEQAAPTVERAATHYRDGEATGFERVTAYATADLAYTVELERFRARFAGGAELVPLALRVTTVFRREEGGWRVAHRHGDPTTVPRPPEAVFPR
jgi:ketosteroid isomerase-like protein